MPNGGMRGRRWLGRPREALAGRPRWWSALTAVPCLGAAQVAAVVAGLLLVAGAAVILRRRAGSTAVPVNRPGPATRRRTRAGSGRARCRGRWTPAGRPDTEGPQDPPPHPSGLLRSAFRNTLLSVARISSARLGPGEGLAVLVPALAEPTDRCGEIVDAGEVTAAKRLTVDDGEEHLDRLSQDAEERRSTSMPARCWQVALRRWSSPDHAGCAGKLPVASRRNHQLGGKRPWAIP